MLAEVRDVSGLWIIIKNPILPVVNPGDGSVQGRSLAFEKLQLGHD